MEHAETRLRKGGHFWTLGEERKPPPPNPNRFRRRRAPALISIDREVRAYPPYMYGAARYIILDDVKDLPFQVSDIYRRLTT